MNLIIFARKLEKVSSFIIENFRQLYQFISFFSLFDRISSDNRQNVNNSRIFFSVAEEKKCVKDMTRKYEKRMFIFNQLKLKVNNVD